MTACFRFQNSRNDVAVEGQKKTRKLLPAYVVIITFVINFQVAMWEDYPKMP